MKHIINRRLWKKIIIIALFAMALTSFRLLWINSFQYTEEQEIAGGELDLRQKDISEGSIELAGEWEFHPNALLSEPAGNDTEKNGPYINVPSDWSSVLNPDHPNPYGYASYHVRILVDAEKDETFTVRVPSVRSASALYANGLLVGGAGDVGETKEDSYARNVPYSSKSIRADENGVIDLALQVTNYVEPRASGVVRSMKFGYEEEVESETELSSMLQVVTAIIFFVHALFAVLVYLVGLRDKRLLYFALFIVALTYMNLTGGDEKVLLQYINLDYTVIFKLSMFVMILISWSLVNSVGPQIREFSNKLLPVYTTLFIVGTLIIIALPMEYLAASTKFTFGSVFVGAAITVFALLRSRKKFHGGIWIALGIVAIGSNYIWWAYAMATGLKVVYYPFDLIIAIICLAGVWFRHYHQMNLETQNQARKLQEADKTKDEFLANTSHELRNPLHSILNMSQAILEREEATLQAKSVQNLETVCSVSKRMSLMLNDLLEITRLQDGNPILDRQPVSLKAITAGVIDMLQYKLEGKLLQIDNHIPTDFPKVMGDENRLTQIMFNLVDNAVKYTREGKIDIHATIRWGRASISIVDTGIGMDETTTQTIFEAYKQGAHIASTSEGGFGLGLNISKQLVELHGGTLRVQSTPGEGSTFTFSIPLADSEATSKQTPVRMDTAAATVESMEEAHADKQPTQALATKQPIQAHVDKQSIQAPKGKQIHSADHPRILVVDDDPVNLEVIETIIGTEQFDLTTVLTGDAALSLLEQQEWDLVISDVMMPQMSGYELTRIIRERFSLSDLPILLLTARTGQENVENGFLSGANDYVTKPIDATELRSRVRALTDVKQSMRESLRMESAWLHAQIQPHFLFNTLNAIFALSEIDTERMQKLLNAFTNVLRGKFNFQNIAERIPIENELNLIRSYVYIEKERFGDRLHVAWDIDDDLAVKIPALLIQPIVENAINHGLMKKSEGGTLTIRVKNNRTHTKISIEDNGIGIDKQTMTYILDQKPASSSGVGLLNTNLRLQRLFGKGLQIHSTPGVGTAISFEVPYAEE